MRFLLDEMLPPAAADALRSLGHEAVSVRDLGLASTPDASVLDAAVAGGWVVVTENAADFVPLIDGILGSGGPATQVVVVHRGRRPSGELVDRLARTLHAWAVANRDPWPGAHWVSLSG